MEIKNLEGVTIEELVTVFNLSFSDYIVPFQLTLEQLKFKIEAEDIKPDLSLGVFDAGRIVAFMLHGLRVDDSGSTVYNAGTGVIPDYRGQGLVGKMYEKLIPQLKALHVRKMVLEVIQENQPAVRAYEKMGYTVSRKLDCFSGTLDILKDNKEVVIKQTSELKWNEFIASWEIQPTWQNAVQTLENIKDLCSIAIAYKHNVQVGYVIFNAVSGKIHQFAVSPDCQNMGIGSSLFSYINDTVKGRDVYVYNVDNRSVPTVCFLKKIGLSKKVVQFEMIREV
ncbi:GNAT family N-acetyltransferase [Chryseobacterium sp. RP-3-3]|uniref:GNAT family N-acetyltransferase n=1 Tax=Chryseobacterium antibioticum TaxID=2728847 RepID=A0A7Y0FRS1_9FLAO|nr:GNAT family N-acetyltransferase [Chryseobacterium antibioticum]NML69719.1 GNAT family N-acetyltransferase [Chryseobacterium antibioticum]